MHFEENDPDSYRETVSDEPSKGMKSLLILCMVFGFLIAGTILLFMVLFFNSDPAFSVGSVITTIELLFPLTGAVLLCIGPARMQSGIRRGWAFLFSGAVLLFLTVFILLIFFLPDFLGYTPFFTAVFMLLFSGFLLFFGFIAVLLLSPKFRQFTSQKNMLLTFVFTALACIIMGLAFFIDIFRFTDLRLYTD